MRSRACSSASRTSTSTAPWRISSAARAGEIVFRPLMRLSCLLPASRAIDVLEQGEQPRDVLVGDAVEHRLRLAPRRHDAGVAQLCQMLRQRGFAKINRVTEL